MLQDQMNVDLHVPAAFVHIKAQPLNLNLVTLREC
jgi:hypothetical protein